MRRPWLYTLLHVSRFVSRSRARRGNRCCPNRVARTCTASGSDARAISGGENQGQKRRLAPRRRSVKQICVGACDGRARKRKVASEIAGVRWDNERCALTEMSRCYGRYCPPEMNGDCSGTKLGLAPHAELPAYGRCENCVCMFCLPPEKIDDLLFQVWLSGPLELEPASGVSPPRAVIACVTTHKVLSSSSFHETRL
jgi:hypothetical protein